MLEILPVLLLNKFLYTSGFQSSCHFISVIASCTSLCFEKQTIACFFLSCLFYFYFDAFYSFIFVYYSLQFLCAEVFFKCNKNIEFTFRISYFVSFCTTGIACSFILYSYLVGFFSINFFSLCFYWACICPLFELIYCSCCFISCFLFSISCIDWFLLLFFGPLFLFYNISFLCFSISIMNNFMLLIFPYSAITFCSSCTSIISSLQYLTMYFCLYYNLLFDVIVSHQHSILMVVLFLAYRKF